MKKIFFAALTLALLNCENKNTAGHPETVDSTEEPADKTAVVNDWERERTDYRGRIQAKIDEMDREIETRRLARKAEKNADKAREYDLDIERREKDRVTLRERLDEIDSRTKENWAEFKKDADDFFDRVREGDDNTKNKGH